MYMIRAIFTVLGVILSVWFLWVALGFLLPMIKFMLIVAVLAVIGVFVVKVIANR